MWYKTFKIDLKPFGDHKWESSKHTKLSLYS